MLQPPISGFTRTFNRSVWSIDRTARGASKSSVPDAAPAQLFDPSENTHPVDRGHQSPTYASGVKLVRLGMNATLFVIGAVWTLQGLNSPFAPTSFMTGSVVWLVVGVATMITAGVLIARTLRRTE